MPRCGALRWKYPTLLSFIAPSPQNFEDSPAHRNQSWPFCGLAVWHKDYAVLPVQILDTHPKSSLSFLIPVSRIKMTMARKRSRVLGCQLQAKRPLVSFFSLHRQDEDVGRALSSFRFSERGRSPSTPLLCAAFVATSSKRNLHSRPSLEISIAQRNLP